MSEAALPPNGANGHGGNGHRPAALTLEVWGGPGGTATVHEDRGETRIALTVSGGAAEITVTGRPAPALR